MEHIETDASIEAAPRPRGRPFQPGQSGNPSGRPKGSKNLATKIREETADGKEMLDYLRRVVNGTEKATARDRIAAAALLFDRGFGKAVGVEFVATAETDALPAETVELATDALESIARSLRGDEDKESK
jgi:hypothetical protein